ncbi:hypothetical protein GA0115236_11314 [Streptomyces sp. IgraMP-1]|nr:hypothetical protein GA0115236_11314 [Streptomyces sp. IgraMP-1]
MHASLDPVVEQPTARSASGACQRSARIATHRRSISAVRGYSSLSMRFLSRHSAITAAPSGSIQVVTKVARFCRAFPSSITSSCTIRRATSGGSEWALSLLTGGTDSIAAAGSAARWNGLRESRAPSDVSPPAALTRRPPYRPRRGAWRAPWTW